MRETAWVLNVSIGTLSEWNKSFDDKMKPFIVPDNRGKASKVTVEIVRRIIEKAKRMKECGGKSVQSSLQDLLWKKMRLF